MTRSQVVLKDIVSKHPQEAEALFVSLDDASVSERGKAVDRLKSFLAAACVDLPRRQDIGDEFQDNRFRENPGRERHENHFVNTMVSYVRQELTLKGLDGLRANLGMTPTGLAEAAL